MGTDRVGRRAVVELSGGNFLTLDPSTGPLADGSTRSGPRRD